MENATHFECEALKPLGFIVRCRH